MNNIFLPNDPLLYNRDQEYRQLYEQKLLKERELFDKQYQEYMQGLQQQQKPAPPEDKLSQLNGHMRDLAQDAKTELQNNAEFVELNHTLQECVQQELVELVKNTINANPDLVTNINRQIQIITDLNTRIKDQERRNMSQINDYLKNYSDMTFDDYKKLKNI